MTKNRALFFIASIALLLPVVTGTILAATDDGTGDGDSLYKYLTVFTEVVTRVRESYVEKPNMEELLAGALDGTTDALDPFSYYVPSAAMETFQARREVGMRHSGMLMLKENGVMYVVGLQDGGPAAKAGLEVGDVVAEIDGQSTRVMPIYRAHEILAGEPGTDVTFKVLHLGEWEDVTFRLGSFATAGPQLSEKRGVAVLRLAGFGSGTAAAVEAALTQAKAAGRERLLVDLRGVAGGDAEAAYDVAGLFARGDLGKLLHREEVVSTFASDREPVWQGPVVVVTDRGTLGAAEILAAVLHQKADADLVGERTFGHAGRRAESRLSTGGRLVYTDAFYAGPDGEGITEGLAPAVRVNRFLLESEIAEEEGEETDVFLEKGIGVLLGEVEVPATEKKEAA